MHNPFFNSADLIRPVQDTATKPRRNAPERLDTHEPSLQIPGHETPQTKRKPIKLFKLFRRKRTHGGSM